MKRLLLIHGDPHSGKTPLAKELRDNYSFDILPLDELYVEFVKTKCEEFYFERLRNYIRQHYHDILDAGGYTKDKFGRDLVREWREYMYAAISDRSSRHDDLAVEGYLLVDCISDIEARMSQSARVFVVHVSNGAYRALGVPLTVSDIAALGKIDEQTA